jgi:hypothetical protein
MSAFQSCNVVLDQSAQMHDLHGVCPESLLLVITEGQVEKDAGQENNDDYAGGCSQEDFKVEMPLAEKPLSEPVKGPEAGALCGFTGNGRYF